MYECKLKVVAVDLEYRLLRVESIYNFWQLTFCVTVARKATSLFFHLTHSKNQSTEKPNFSTGSDRASLLWKSLTVSIYPQFYKTWNFPHSYTKALQTTGTEHLWNVKHGWIRLELTLIPSVIRTWDGCCSCASLEPTFEHSDTRSVGTWVACDQCASTYVFEGCESPGTHGCSWACCTWMSWEQN